MGTQRISYLAVVALLASCTPGPSADAAPPSTGVALAPRTTVAASAPSSHTDSSASAYPRPTDAELRARLTPLQLAVTQRGATEPPFQNDFWDNHQPGLYVDVATGEPLFSSQDKFESGTGWPSFTQPVDPTHVVTRTDSTLGMERTEVLSRGGGSHLGHVFDDGPAPTGMRYCINSASLRFIPAARLAAEGYGAYASRFGVATTASEAPPATSNKCALPPPGEKPGCSATLATAIFARSAARDARLPGIAGVLGVTPGYEGSQRAVEVTFDPAVVTYADLLAAWVGSGEGGDPPATVYVQDDGQRSAALGSHLREVDATPFRRE